jgi:hypothetical protein
MQASILRDEGGAGSDIESNCPRLAGAGIALWQGEGKALELEPESELSLDLLPFLLRGERISKFTADLLWISCSIDRWQSPPKQTILRLNSSAFSSRKRAPGKNSPFEPFPQPAVHGPMPIVSE